ncbi:MAG: 4Fe-4S binding protein [Deltaproteobacteria bacterium]|nr:4Fe-4S binding protein [Deltaproteobacteria bacterium]
MALGKDFIKYCSDFVAGIVSTLKGMCLTMVYFFKSKSTMEYPEVRPVIAENHRGIHQYIEEQCLVCMQCVRVCPVDCIAITAIGRGKDRLITQFDVDYSKCLFCNLCCEACGPDCLSLGREFDFAQNSREQCVFKLASPKTSEQIEQFKKEYALRQAELEAKKAKEKQAAAPAGCTEDQK